MAKQKTLTQDDVKKLSALASLPLSDEEIKLFTPQLGDVITYFNLLDEVDTADVEPTFHPSGNDENRFQEQKISSQTLTNRKALENAPRTQNGVIFAKSKLTGES